MGNLKVPWYEFLEMTLKQEIHALVDELPDDSPLLMQVRENLRMSNAIEEAVEDIRAGRVYEADAFMAEVRARWPQRTSE